MRKLQKAAGAVEAAEAVEAVEAMVHLAKKSCAFVANRRKSLQIAKIATYAGFADPKNQPQQRAQFFFSDVGKDKAVLGMLFLREFNLKIN